MILYLIQYHMGRSCFEAYFTDVDEAENLYRSLTRSRDIVSGAVFWKLEVEETYRSFLREFREA